MRLCVFWVAAVVMGGFFFTAASGLAGTVMTLEQCLEKGIENNTRLKAAMYDVEGAAYEIKSARADFFPSLSSGFTANELISVNSKGPTETDYLNQSIRQFHIKLSQTLYAGHRIANTYEKARIRKQVLEAEAFMSQLELIYSIETTFYRLMKAEQDVIASTQAVERLTEGLKSAQAFFEKELVPYVDVLQARVDLTDAKEKLGIARNNVNRERVALFALMNQNEDPDVAFKDELSPLAETIPDFPASMQQARENRPDLESLSLQLEMARKDAAIALGRYLPSVRLDAAYNDQNRDYDDPGVSGSIVFDRDQRNRYWTVGVNVSWELFDGGRAWYENKKSTVEQQKLETLINEAENTISSGIRKAILSMREAEQRLQGALNSLEAAEEYYALEERRLNAGISTISDFLEAQSRLIRSQGNHAQAILDFRLAQSELNLMTGQVPSINLLSELNQ